AGKALYRREKKGWKAYPDPADAGKPARIAQVVWDDKGVLVRLDSGELRLVEGVADTPVLTAEAHGFGAAWKEVRHLAEVGDWLLVAPAKGLFAYHRPTHRWQRLSSAACEGLELDRGQKEVTACWWFDGEGRLHRFSPAGLPRNQLV